MSRTTYNFTFKKQDNDFQLIQEGLETLNGEKIGPESANKFQYRKAPRSDFSGNNHVIVQQNNEAIQVTIDAPYQYHAGDYLKAAISKLSIERQQAILTHLKGKMKQKSEKAFLQKLYNEITLKASDTAAPMQTGRDRALTNSFERQRLSSSLGAMPRQLQPGGFSLDADAGLSVSHELEDVDPKRIQAYYVEELRKIVQERNRNKQADRQDLVFEDLMYDDLLRVGLGTDPNSIAVKIGEKFEARADVVNEQTLEQMIIAAKSFEAARKRAATPDAKPFEGFNLRCESKDQAVWLYTELHKHHINIKSVKFPGQEAAPPQVALMPNPEEQGQRPERRASFAL